MSGYSNSESWKHLLVELVTAVVVVAVAGVMLGASMRFLPEIDDATFSFEGHNHCVVFAVACSCLSFSL